MVKNTVTRGKKRKLFVYNHFRLPQAEVVRLRSKFRVAPFRPGVSLSPVLEKIKIGERFLIMGISVIVRKYRLKLLKKKNK